MEGAYDGTETARIVTLRPDLIVRLIVKNQKEGKNIKGNLFFHLRAHLLKKKGPGVVFCLACFYVVEKLHLS